MHLYFQIGSLLYLGLIAIIYFRKKSIKTIENNSFKAILLCSIITLILDIVNTEYNVGFGGGKYTVVLFKLFLFSVLTFLFAFSYYVYTLSSKYHIDNIEYKKHPHKKEMKRALFGYIIVVFILNTILAFLPVQIYSTGKAYLQEGPAMDFTYVSTFIGLMSLLGLIFQDRKHAFSKKYFPVYFLCTFGLGTMALQIIFADLPIVSIVEASVCIITFYTMENPDARLIYKLNEAKENAEKANQAKTDFLSSMSHEIRTPLNAIVGFGQALAKEDISGTAKEEVQDILMASNTLLDIVNGILDISKIEANKIEIVNNEYSTKKMINEITSLINARIGSKPIDLKVLIDENLPPMLYGDSIRVKQVIINLLTNAVKYTQEGRILFQIRADNDLNNDTSKLTISVQDTGMGMTEEDLKQIFTRFQRFDMDKNQNIEGTGLGMAITKSLVDLMGGEIQVKSKYGEGSTFTIILNQKIIHKEVEEDVKEETQIKAFNASGSKILVVDDNKINLKVAERLLREYNVTVETVNSGSACIDKILDGKKYDLIFMDIMMPKMNGIETLENLKNIVGFKMPVVALTADVISGMEEKYIEKGFDDCLAKPIVEEELYYMLKKFLKETDENPNTITTQDLESNDAHNIELLESNRINVKAGLELLKDMEMYEMTLEEFYNELQNKITDLTKYKEEGNMDDYAILAHALKSEARYVGCNELGDIAYEHELAGKENNQELVNEKFSELTTEANRVYEVIKKYLGE